MMPQIMRPQTYQAQTTKHYAAIRTGYNKLGGQIVSIDPLIAPYPDVRRSSCVMYRRFGIIFVLALIIATMAISKLRSLPVKVFKTESV